MTLFEMAQKIRLEKTCNCSPEQYDAYIGDELIGYLRLRWGSFTVQYLNPSGEYVYSANTIGDGMFDDSEREGHLAVAKLRLINKHYETLQEDY